VCGKIGKEEARRRSCCTFWLSANIWVIRWWVPLLLVIHISVWSCIAANVVNELYREHAGCLQHLELLELLQVSW